MSRLPSLAFASIRPGCVSRTAGAACVLLIGIVHAEASAQVVVSGYVEDAETRERLAGATITDGDRGVATNAYGFFSLRTTADSVTASFVGYERRTVGVEGWAEGGSVGLRPRPASIGEAVVVAEPPPSMTATRFTAADIKRAPTLLGEADVLRTFHRVPGVSFGSEGSTGLHVRGGSPDQTLVLLDGAPVYNVSHLIGAFSVFNVDAVRSAGLVKGGSTRHGGRLAGVLDVQMREGSPEERRTGVTIGLLASRAVTEGPIGSEGRASYIVAARRTYADLLAAPLLRRNGSSLGYAFGDLSAKVNTQRGQTRLFASVYAGRDGFGMDQEETFRTTGKTEWQGAGLRWGNVTGTVRAARPLSPTVFADAIIVHSRYGFETDRSGATIRSGPEGPSETGYEFANRSRIVETSARTAVAASVARSADLVLGAELGVRSFTPVSARRTERFGDAPPSTTEVGGRTLTTAHGVAFAGLQADIVSGLRAEGGLRVSPIRLAATAAGPDPLVEERETDRWAIGLEPRLALDIDPRGPLRARAALARTWQPLHLVSNSGAGLPSDLWVPATSTFGPASARHASAEVSWRRGGFGATVGAYASWMEGMAEYRDGAGFLSLQEAWEQDVVRASGRSSGIEFLVERTAGRLTGSLAYTWSRTTRQAPEIRDGEPFPYRYDRTHDVHGSLGLRLSPRREVVVEVTYATGAAVTLPVGRYGTAGVVYGPRNAARFPPYVRADVAYSVDYRSGRLVLGLYNVTNRHNPYYMTLETVGGADGGVRDVYRQVSLFPILPSVSYEFDL